MNRSIHDIVNQKKQKKISAITSYDYTMASLCDEAGIDLILVGDSAGVVMLGYENTIPVKMRDMCLFTGAVNRATKMQWLFQIYLLDHITTYHNR